MLHENALDTIDLLNREGIASKPIELIGIGSMQRFCSHD